MTRFYVMLQSTADICSFVTAATGTPTDIDVVSGRYTVDAKSIMGLFSLKLSDPLQVCVYGTDEDGAAFREAVSDYICEAPNA